MKSIIKMFFDDIILGKILQSVSLNNLFSLHLTDYKYWRILVEKFPFAKEIDFKSFDNWKLLIYILAYIDSLICVPENCIGPQISLLINPCNKNYDYLKRLLYKFPSNYLIVYNCIKKTPSLIYYIYPSFHDDDQIIFISKNLRFASQRIKRNLKLVLKIIKESPDQYDYVSSEIKCDTSLIKAVLEKNGRYITKIPKICYENDIEMCILAVKSYPRSYIYIPEKYKMNKKILRIVMEMEPSFTFFNIPCTIKYRKFLFLNLFKRSYLSDSDVNCLFHKKKPSCIACRHSRLGNNSIDFCDDLDIMLEAVKNKPNIIHYGTKKIIKNKKIAKAIVKKDGLFLSLVANKYKNDKKIVLTAIENNPFSIKSSSRKMRDNFTVAFRTISKEPCLYKYISKRLQHNDKIIVQTLKYDGKMILYTPDFVKENEKYALLSINNNANSFKYLSDKLKYNKDFIDKLMNTKYINSYLFSLFPKDIIDRDILFKAILIKIYPFSYLPDKFIHDKELRSILNRNLLDNLIN